jgi:hypothetical protein
MVNHRNHKVEYFLRACYCLEDLYIVLTEHVNFNEKKLHI